MTKNGQNDVGNVTSLLMFFLNTGGRRFTEASNEWKQSPQQVFMEMYVDKVNSLIPS